MTEAQRPTTQPAEAGDSARCCVDCGVQILREQVGEPTNPRYLLWRVWHGDNPAVRAWEYTEWMGKRWPEFCAEAKRNRRLLSEQDHADFDAWLLHWVRREIATTGTNAKWDWGMAEC